MQTKNNSGWAVPEKFAGMSLQDFLAEAMPASRRVAKQHIDAKVVRVNGRAVWMARHALRAGDSVEVAARVASPTDKSRQLRKLAILVEDADYIIADKPRGILTNEAEYSVESVLRVQTRNPQLCASHRLDRDTTGCLLFSKSPAAHAAAVEVFKRHLVAKTYRAAVAGRWDADATTIDLALEGERAVTNVRCVAARDEASYIIARIETGRTHQIRKHLAMARHPVLGDTQHGRKTLADPRLAGLTYPLLHAAEIEMTHPLDSARVLKAFSPVPQDFHKWLVALGLEKRRA